MLGSIMKNVNKIKLTSENTTDFGLYDPFELVNCWLEAISLGVLTNLCKLSATITTSLTSTRPAWTSSWAIPSAVSVLLNNGS